MSQERRKLHKITDDPLPDRNIDAYSTLVELSIEELPGLLGTMSDENMPPAEPMSTNGLNRSEYHKPNFDKKKPQEGL